MKSGIYFQIRQCSSYNRLFKINIGSIVFFIQKIGASQGNDVIFQKIGNPLLVGIKNNGIVLIIQIINSCSYRKQPDFGRVKRQIKFILKSFVVNFIINTGRKSCTEIRLLYIKWIEISLLKSVREIFISKLMSQQRFVLFRFIELKTLIN